MKNNVILLSTMKQDIHPNYAQTKIACACGNSIETGSTGQDLKVELCSTCHPFYTGKQNIVDTAGRAERYKKQMAAKEALQDRKGRTAKRAAITEKRADKADA